jgi:hypothetical protein
MLVRVCLGLCLQRESPAFKNTVTQATKKKKSYPQYHLISTEFIASNNPASFYKMPSVDELISSIKAKSNSISFLSQAKKRKSEETTLAEKKKSRTVYVQPPVVHMHVNQTPVADTFNRPAKNENNEDDLLKKLNRFGEQFMQSVDSSSKKAHKKAKKVVEKMEVAPVDSEASVFPDEDLEGFEDEDEIDQLFGIGKDEILGVTWINAGAHSMTPISFLANAANGQTVQKEVTNNSTKAKGPEVVVFAEALKKTITGSSKADYKAFMVSSTVYLLPQLKINLQCSFCYFNFYPCSHQRYPRWKLLHRRHLNQSRKWKKKRRIWLMIVN